MLIWAPRGGYRISERVTVTGCICVHTRNIFSPLFEVWGSPKRGVLTPNTPPLLDLPLAHSLSQLLGGAAVSSHCYQLGVDCTPHPYHT